LQPHFASKTTSKALITPSIDLVPIEKIKAKRLLKSEPGQLRADERRERECALLRNALSAFDRIL
jgi:hypothetical protein